MSPRKVARPKPTTEELQAARNHQFRMKLVGDSGSVIKWAIAGGTLILVVWKLAGETTILNAIVSFTTDLGFFSKLLGVVALIASAWGGAITWLWRRNIKKSSQHIADLEKQINKRRKSSQLTETGKSNPRV